jgi:hypothetical protein
MVGLSRLFNPIKTFKKNSGIELANDTDLLNEIRGISALMLVGGILCLLGIVMNTLGFSSHLIAVLIFLGFALGRIFSWVKDGKPNKLIAQGLVSELILGIANLVMIVLY